MSFTKAAGTYRHCKDRSPASITCNSIFRSSQEECKEECTFTNQLHNKESKHVKLESLVEMTHTETFPTNFIRQVTPLLGALSHKTLLNNWGHPNY